MAAENVFLASVAVFVAFTLSGCIDVNLRAPFNIVCSTITCSPAGIPSINDTFYVADPQLIARNTCFVDIGSQRKAISKLQRFLNNCTSKNLASFHYPVESIDFVNRCLPDLSVVLRYECPSSVATTVARQAHQSTIASTSDMLHQLNNSEANQVSHQSYSGYIIYSTETAYKPPSINQSISSISNTEGAVNMAVVAAVIPSVLLLMVACITVGLVVCRKRKLLCWGPGTKTWSAARDLSSDPKHTQATNRGYMTTIEPGRYDGADVSETAIAPPCGTAKLDTAQSGENAYHTVSGNLLPPRIQGSSRSYAYAVNIGEHHGYDYPSVAGTMGTPRYADIRQDTSRTMSAPRYAAIQQDTSGSTEHVYESLHGGQPFYLTLVDDSQIFSSKTETLSK